MEKYEKKLEEISKELRAISPVFTDEALRLIYIYCMTLFEKLNSERIIEKPDFTDITYTYF